MFRLVYSQVEKNCVLTINHNFWPGVMTWLTIDIRLITNFHNDYDKGHQSIMSLYAQYSIVSTIMGVQKKCCPLHSKLNVRSHFLISRDDFEMYKGRNFNLFWVLYILKNISLKFSLFILFICFLLF